ncbi:hypothetical protein R70723_14935 [Paenibacillus sp. FSL R7-0273]|uniref:hypothetical protein n=1 Tax=Paenibacillus sp. FSL R7-0273 TaxID=1536772 RepID=UPI0004F7359E|nr:hypothetical protein [Paenibacillus sp. FSL R7-0273]AIQ47029.1 hypothetical protein R70723_14935 [Paenibacillus sp. FSL R7-0273]OMF97212.1 hypothetical protein BK144_00695 [Paenibacillus sp. FSL R7-0273]
MTNPEIKNSNKSGSESADAAWSKMQKLLAEEPVNPVWDSWGQAGPYKAEDVEAGRGISSSVFADTGGLPDRPAPATAAGKTSKASSRRKKRMTRSRKWAASAAAATLIAVVLATPVGNTAMAAILNQFRMQEVTVINESDIRELFYQINEGGTVSEAENKFGSFTTSYGTFHNKILVDELQSVVGYPAISSAMQEGIHSVQVTESRDATMTLKVDALNDALKRLGAEQLLPESVDGKPITLHLPETVIYDLSTADGKWASLSQMNTPSIAVDPSIEVDEALQAVLNLPVLPDHWKTSLQHSRVLAGEIPMPLIKGDFAKEITVADTSVILQQHDYSQGPVFNATWVHEGQMFELSGGSVYPDKDEFIAKLQELITE